MSTSSLVPSHLLVKKITGRKGNQELAEVMYEHYQQGLSLAEVGRVFGRTRQSVHAGFKRRGWAMRPHLRYGPENHFFRGGPQNDRSANHKVEKAIIAGRISKQPCEVCGDLENVYAHHDDYNKPLDVRWLCVKCHFTWHEQHAAIPKGVEA